MRNTLLIAAAALAASVISSEAQVYSQNVVGYANVGSPNAGQDYLITVPFTVGVSNGANEVFGTNLTAGTQILVWNGSGYTTTIYDNSNPQGTPQGATVFWYQSDDFTFATIPTLPVGQGFFIIPASPLTNTFAGAVAVNVGTSNNMVLANAGQDYLVASVVPYAGAVTNGTSSTGGPDLNNLTAGTQVLIWNGSGYTTTIYDNTNPQGTPAGATNYWYASDDFTFAPVPTISVGQGFFIIPAAPYTWTTGL